MTNEGSLSARLKRWARAVKRDVVALWIGARDPRTPLLAKAFCAAVAAYALSPIDLIPDFIPVLGYLDEAILLPLAIVLAVRMIPSPLMAEFRAEAERRSERPSSRGGAAIVVVLWIATAWLSLRLFCTPAAGGFAPSPRSLG